MQTRVIRSALPFGPNVAGKTPAGSSGRDNRIGCRPRAVASSERLVDRIAQPFSRVRPMVSQSTGIGVDRLAVCWPPSGMQRRRVATVPPSACWVTARQ